MSRRRNIKNVVTCKKDCRVCGGGPCSPHCGYCMDFKRVQRIDLGSSVDPKDTLGQLRREIDMGAEIQFKPEGVGSRGNYLKHIKDGAKSVNKLKTAIQKSWYDAETILKLLETEGLVRNDSQGTYPEYVVTDWGIKEVEKFEAWRGTAPSAEPAIKHEPEASDEPINHPVPQPEKKPQQTIHIASPPLPEIKDAPPPAAAQPDAYHKAYTEILIEKFGEQVSFKEVQERVNASL